MNGTVRTALILVSGLALSACQLLPDGCANIACGACPPPLSLTVKSASGAAVSDVTLTGVDGDCTQEADATRCSVFGSGPGTYEFDVSAPGFQTHHVKETIAPVEATGCCSCGYDFRIIDVTLQPQ